MRDHLVLHVVLLPMLGCPDAQVLHLYARDVERFLHRRGVEESAQRHGEELAEASYRDAGMIKKMRQYERLKVGSSYPSTYTLILHRSASVPCLVR